jgi:hypothetical protein
VPEQIGLGRSSRTFALTKVETDASRNRRKPGMANVKGRRLRRKPHGPWPVKPRLAVASFFHPGPQGSGRRVSHVTENEATVTRDRARGASHAFGARGSVGSVVVLAGCLGCRSRRAALGLGAFGHQGLAGRLSLHKNEGRLCGDGEGALEPARSGESHEHASSETGGLLVRGVLVDGRRPGPLKSSSFDEAVAEMDRAGPGDGDAA